jgi:hypothetical protein
MESVPTSYKRAQAVVVQIRIEGVHRSSEGVVLEVRTVRAGGPVGR